SENIEKIVKFIEKLVLTGAAYAVSNGDVYFAVRKFEKYGKLSNRDIDQLRAGARVETGEVKSDPLDFALWKSAKPGEPSWQSPWGGGRPGWHIECSVMSIGELGTETLDIHGGGLDLVFPHHENETAQSEACTGKTFAKYWVHNGFVTVDKEKMSKSLGNFFSLKDVLAKYEPMVLRMFLLSQHYRTPLDFSDTVLKQTKNAWEGLSDIYELAMFVFHKAGVTSVTELNSVDAAVLAKFEAVMSDDFNSERGLAVVFELKKEIISAVNKRDIQTLKVKVATLKLLIEKVLGLMFSPIVYDFGKVNISLEAQSMLAQREAAKKNKDFTAADIARDGIKKLGFIVEDTPWGQRLKKVL
ncbi:MAG: cysteine--tRNA ligase, partial [Elusimicrobiota bacterium]